MSMSAEVDKLLESIKQEKDIIIKVRNLKKVIHDNDLRIKDVAIKLEVKDSYVCHLLRLNRLPEIIVDGYYSKNISLSHLFIISRLKIQETMIKAYEKILSDNLTILGTEELVRDILYGVKTNGDYLDNDEKNDFIQTIRSKKLNIEPQIIQTRIKSKIILEIKGSLAQTGKILRNLIKYLKVWQE